MSGLKIEKNGVSKVNTKNWNMRLMGNSDKNGVDIKDEVEGGEIRGG